MSSTELVDRVRELRERGRTPKEIARALGIRPAEAARLVRAAAEVERAEEQEAPLVACWISSGWDAGLTVDGRPEWPVGSAAVEGEGGLVSMLVARRHRFDKVSVCGFLVDVYCLGVKNAMGPKIMDEPEFTVFARDYFSAHAGDPILVPVELAAEVAFGAVDYARGLGFEPHPDFAKAAGLLGSWTGPSTITFGKDGKPFYVSGPRDNPRSVVRTLERTVGAGNYDYLVVA